MPGVDLVVVPLDRSEPAERALAPAVAIASRTGAPIELLAVSREPAERPALEDYLARVTASLPEALKVVADVVVGDVDPATVIARRSGPGVLVTMSSHGRSGWGATLIGSVTEHVLIASGEPVLVVGPHVAKDVALAMGRLVVAVDASDGGRTALEPAERIAGLLGLAVETVDVPGRDAARRLAGLTDVALFAVATHGREGLSRIREGSVAMELVHLAARPVLVVRRAP